MFDCTIRVSPPDSDCTFAQTVSLLIHFVTPTLIIISLWFSISYDPWEMATSELWLFPHT